MRAIVAVVGLLACFSALAESYVWTGAEDAYWTNGNNWASGVAPGVIDLPDGSTNLNFGCEAVFSGASAQTTINLDGLHSIFKVTVSGAATPQYTFGTSNAQVLHFEDQGVFTVASDVVNVPLLTCGLGINRDQPAAGGKVFVENNAAGELVINNFGYVIRPVKPAWGEIGFVLQGTGPKRLAGVFTQPNSFQVKYYFNGTGKITIDADVTKSSTSHGLDVNGAKTIEITENGKFRFGDSYCYLVAYDDVTLMGAGTFLFASQYRSVNNNYAWYESEIRGNKGKTVTFAPGLTVSNLTDDNGAGKTSAWKGGMQLKQSNGMNVVFEADNTMPGHIRVMAPFTVSVPKVENLGLDGIVEVGGKGRIVFTSEEADTISSGIVLTGAATLEKRGTGFMHYTGLAFTEALTVVGPWSFDTAGTYGTLTAGTGNATLSAGANVTFAGLATSGGTLDIITGAGSITVTGASGAAPSWLTYEGGPAEFDENGVLRKTVIGIDTQIAGHGDVVPDDAAKNVGITSAGSGAPDTLEKTVTSVKSLTQQDAAPTEIALGADETLKTDRLTVGADAADLSVGTVTGQGTLAALSGAFSFDAENPDSTLTVRAALGIPTTADVAKMGEGWLRFDNGFAWAGTLNILDGAVAVTNAAGLNVKLVGTGTFVKEGAETWTLSKDQGDFRGDFVIAGGVAAPTGVGKFGSQDAGAIVVEKGGQLDPQRALNGVTFANFSFGSREVKIAGDGPDGRGALVRSGCSSDTSNYGGGLAKYLTLADDASIGIFKDSYQVLYASANGRADFGGHTLTLRGNGGFIFDNTVITNGGKVVAQEPADLQIRGTTDFGANGGTDVEMHGGTFLTFTGTKPQTGRLTITDGLVQLRQQGESKDPSLDWWNGPIDIAEGATFRIYCYGSGVRPLRIGGVVSGAGGIEVNGVGTYEFGTQANTFSGAFKFYGGGAATYAAKLRLNSASVIPDFTKFTVTNYGRIVIPGEAIGAAWPTASINALMDKANLSQQTVVLVDTSAADATVDVSKLGYANQVNGFGNNGTGRLTFIGTSETPRTFVSLGGRTVFDHVACPLSDGLHVLNGDVDVVGSRLSSATDDPTAKDNTVSVGEQADGVLRISDPDTVLTNRFYVGHSSTDYGFGAVYQTDGKVALRGGAEYSLIGYNGYGYWELTGGELALLGRKRIGYGHQGVLAIRGGTVRLGTFGTTIDATIGASDNTGLSVGVIDMTGGVLDAGTGRFNLGEWNAGHTDATAVFTLAGDATVTSSVVGAPFNMGLSTRMTGILNLNGGLYESHYLVQYSYTDDFSSHSYINMNGGTWRSLATSPYKPIFHAVGRASTDVNTVFADGFTIDTNGKERSLNAPLKAPTGLGVTAVDGTGVVGQKFVGPPVIKIVNGEGSEGFGASAYADFDSTNGVVTGIRITSPGCNYTKAKALVLYARTTNILTNDVTLGEQACGALVKAGAGKLTIASTNTVDKYEVRAGELVFGCADAVPAQVEVRLRGGTVSAANGGAVPAANWTFDALGSVEYAGAFAFPSGSTVTLENLDQIDVTANSYTLIRFTGGLTGDRPTVANEADLPKDWRVRWSANSLRLVRQRGTMLFVR